MLGLAAARALQAALGKAGATLRTDLDPLAAIWAERPALPAAAVYEHLPPFASTRAETSWAAVRAAMQQHGADAHFISTLDDIAWLFNLRGADVNYNPVFIAHALLRHDGATLFVGAGKIDAALPPHWPQMVSA